MRRTIYIATFNFFILMHNFFSYYFFYCFYIIFIITIIIIITFNGETNSSNRTSRSIIIIIIIISSSSIDKISISLTMSTSVFELFIYFLLFYINIPHHYYFKGPQWKYSYIAYLSYPCHCTLWRTFLPQFLILMNLYFYTF